jgi:hypothetical protein
VVLSFSELELDANDLFAEIIEKRDSLEVNETERRLLAVVHDWMNLVRMCLAAMATDERNAEPSPRGATPMDIKLAEAKLGRRKVKR